MNRRFAFEPTARETYLTLRKRPDSPLYVAVTTLLTQLLNDPGDRQVRQLRYRPDTWGTRVNAGDDRWLVLWRQSRTDPDVVEVHYVGPAPGEA